MAKRGMAMAALAALTAALCPAQFDSANSAAKAIEIHGQVSVLKDNYPWAIQLGATIQPQQTVVTGADGFARFQVSDGSTFDVFPNSRAQFRANPGSLKDLVDLMLGRIRVHIEKIGGQPNPNSVRTPTAVISVRGTTFDVIAAEESTTVAVEEGQVAVRHLLRPSNDERILNAGEALTVFKNEPLAKRVDRGRIYQQIMGSAWDALATVMRSGRLPGRTGTPGAGGGPTLPGDTGGQAPPPSGGDSGGNAPAPPPPPPPPPPGN